MMANINLSEISLRIKEQIKAYKEEIRTDSIGRVIEVGDGALDVLGNGIILDVCGEHRCPHTALLGGDVFVECTL